MFTHMEGKEGKKIHKMLKGINRTKKQKPEEMSSQHKRLLVPNAGLNIKHSEESLAKVNCWQKCCLVLQT